MKLTQLAIIVASVNAAAIEQNPQIQPAFAEGTQPTNQPSYWQRFKNSLPSLPALPSLPNFQNVHFPTFWN